MDAIRRFGEYAAAFEKAYESDDWSVLEPYFTEDAVYEIDAEPPFGARCEGREKVFAFLKQSVDSLDRRFDERRLELREGPRLVDGDVWVSWRVSYARAGVPDLVFDGEETARFEGDRIARLADRFPRDTTQRAAAFFEQHGAKLKPAGG